MSDITNVVRKELRELLTPGSVISVLIMVVLFAGLGGLIGGEVEKAQALPVFGIANADDSTVVIDGDVKWNAYDYLRAVYSSVPSEEIGNYIKTVDVEGVTDYYDLMTTNGINSLIVIDPSFADNVQYNMTVTDASDLRPVIIWEYYLYEPSGMFGSISSSTI